MSFSVALMSFLGGFIWAQIYNIFIFIIEIYCSNDDNFYSLPNKNTPFPFLYP